MANTLPKPDHRMQIVDPETGVMTPEFFRLVLLIVAALNALP